MKNYYKYELNMLVANILSLVMMIVPIVILEIIGINVYTSLSNGFLLISLLIYFIIHELLHALGFSLFAKNKKSLKFGIKLEKGVLYALCQEKISKSAILISLLLPLIILTFITFPISLLLKLNLLTLLSIANFGGAIGDILMFFLIIKTPKDIEYIDYNSDIGVYLLSKNDLSNIKSFGLKLIESGDSSNKKIDESIKRLYISRISTIILAVLIFISIVSLIIENL
ncbi:MAG: DUF3267 domain-containing protein [Bacilli bacterium]|nr:DUF3267 domain-containing protein [Bacilli bacterium]